MTDEYKILPSYLAQRFTEAADQLRGRPMQETFVESTRKIVAVRGNYRRYGVYWWAVKRVLRDNGIDVGTFDCDWLRDEYTIRTKSGVVDPESTLLAAWIFAEDNTFAPETEFEIDGQLWVIDDPDQA